LSKKTIAMFLDGTWNTPQSMTNVFKASQLVSADNNGVEQKVYYAKGLGTQKFETFRGGVFGKGLKKNVIDAYKWLSENYVDGDDLFVFGYSRGSFTATSVTGMIMRWGLVYPDEGLTAEEVFDRYEHWKEDQLTPIYKLNYYRDYKPDLLTLDGAQYLEKARSIPIKMIGIWDSVATVGVPLGNFARFSRNALKFHNPRWSKFYENFYHALAIDEYRKPFRSLLLHDYVPDEEDIDETRDDRIKLNARVEQRWFCGCHSDVGGGKDVVIADLPFHWILEKASSHGLKFENHISQPTRVYEHKIGDSFSKFVGGFYKIFRLGKRFYRKIGPDSIPVTGGKITPINEIILTLIKEIFPLLQPIFWGEGSVEENSGP